MQSQIAKTPLGPIEYTLQGKGPVILICHGTSSDCQQTEGSAPLIAAGFSILAPSRPGYGRTPLSVGRSADQAADALAALLDCLGIQECGLQAISGGGPTGIALAALHPERVRKLALVAAISRTEDRSSEPNYQTQKGFYGPLHGLYWGLLGLMGRLFPAQIARTTLSIFSSHDPDDTLGKLSRQDVLDISRFYHRASSRLGASNDLQHAVEEDWFAKIHGPTLVVHSREDRSVLFRHAEWSLAHLPQAELCEGGMTGHFFWIGPDYARISGKMIDFFSSAPASTS